MWLLLGMSLFLQRFGFQPQDLKEQKAHFTHTCSLKT